MPTTDRQELADIRRERARSLKSVQIIFGVLALASVCASLFVSARGLYLGLPEHSVSTIAIAFLGVAVMDTAMIFAWEHIFRRMDP